MKPVAMKANGLLPFGTEYCDTVIGTTPVSRRLRVLRSWNANDGNTTSWVCTRSRVAEPKRIDATVVGAKSSASRANSPGPSRPFGKEPTLYTQACHSNLNTRGNV